jgi:hypothetical protein
VTAASAGGVGVVTLARANLPNVDFVTDATGTVSVTNGTNVYNAQSGADGNVGTGGSQVGHANVTAALSGHLYLNANVLQTAVQQMPPFRTGSWYWKL